MKKLTWLSSVLIVMSVAPPAVAGNVKGVTIPVIGQIDTLQKGDGVAQKGDVIFSQTLIAQRTAKLTESFYIKRDNRFDSTYDLKAGDLLYSVNFPDHDTAYCSVAHGFSQNPSIGKPWDSQICLIDTDKDGRFDLEYAGATQKFDLSPLSLNILWSDNLDFDPVPYLEQDTDNSASVQARVELTKFSSKKAKFKIMLQLIEGDWVEHGAETIRFEKDVVFPVTLDIYGAKLQITSVDKTSLTYQVESGFSQTESILLE